MEELEQDILNSVAKRIDLDALLAIARQAPPIAGVPRTSPQNRQGEKVRIGYLRDSAFTFYYPENLEALEHGGAVLVSISALHDKALPYDLHALYIGGGFPETHAKALAANRSMLRSIRSAAAAGLPIYSECGGLILLSRSLSWKGAAYDMAGVFPFDIEVSDKAQGHGYSELLVDKANPFFPIGATLRGHEFHYSAKRPQCDWPDTVCEVRRGTGCFRGRDAAIFKNVWASYTHLHALATPDWAAGLLSAARQFATSTTTTHAHR